MSMITSNISDIEKFVEANGFRRVCVTFKSGKWVFRGEL